MRFETIITEIRSFGDRQVNCSHFIVRSTESFCQINEDAIEQIKRSGVDLRKSQEAHRRKTNALHLLETLRSGEGISDPFSPLPRSPFSIYPLNSEE